ncbi:hotdog fold thioesterase [Sabulibacter ruber]|uniref:hotdog fold thioesterase n=1 Tax=Sabulibacter ruber TaxID=2811901 RepID=UPI001A96681B
MKSISPDLEEKKAAQAFAGMEYFEAIERGELPYPPLLQTLDFKVISVKEGEAVFAFQPQQMHYNSLGTVHGGVIAALLDTAMGCSLHTLLPAHTTYTTLELKTNFLKAATIESGELTAVGKVIHRGRTTAFLEAQLLNQAGSVFAHGVSTCLLLNS